MVIRSLLIFLLVAVILHESEQAPTPNKNDPFKPIYRILKELRKVQKYKYKYGGGNRGHRDDDSSESSEEYNHPFQGGGFRPNGSGSGNRPSIFPSLGVNNGGGNGGGQRQPSSGSPGGNGGNGGGGGGSGDPFEQLNQGFSNLLQGLGSLSLGQLIGGGGGSSLSFPSN